MNRKSLVVLGVIVLSSGLIGFLLLTRGHSWGDDFAGYLLQAKAIVDGQMHEFVIRNTFAAENSDFRFGGVMYPWGFPLLIAPVYAIFGLKVVALKLVLTAAYMAFLVALYGLARTRLSHLEALLVTAVMAFNVNMLQAQNEILSDLPFLFLSTLALWLLDRYQLRDQGWSRTAGEGGVIGLVIFVTAFMRPNGFLLLIPLAAVQLMRILDPMRREGKSAEVAVFVATPYLVCGLCYAVQAVIFPNSSVGLREQWATFSLQTIWPSLGFTFWLPSTFFAAIIPWEQTAYIVLLIFFALGVTKGRGADWPMLLYALATFGLYGVYPLRQNLRYLYPILPVLFIFAMRGMGKAAAWLAPKYQVAARALIYVVWAGVALASLWVAIVEAQNNLAAGRDVPGGWQAGPFSTASQEMFAFVRQQVPAHSIVIFFKPRAMRLFTDRDAFITFKCGDLPKANYLVLVNDNDRNDQIAPDEIQQCNASVRIDEVYRQQGFIAYHIQPRP